MFSPIEDKLVSKDRILVLKPIPGAKVKSSTGLTDPRLFQGGNNLHALQSDLGLWRLKFDSGIIPDPLKSHFTKFSMLYQAVKSYYNGRGVDIVEIKDVNAESY